MDISIIIPMYNAQMHLSKLLNSIYNQDACDIDFEVIIVDDVSTDKSINCVLNYIQSNNIRNLKLVKQNINGGTASARNKGLCSAKGNWIQFIDSDDWLQDNYFSLISKHIHNTHSNCLVFGNKYHFKEVTKIATPIGRVDDRMLGYKNTVVNKLYHHSIIKTFETEFYFEDIVWLCEMINQENIQCSIISDLYYNINRTNEYSKTAKFNSNEWYLAANQIVKRSKHYNNSSREFVLETFTGTLFSKQIEAKYKLRISALNILINYKYLYKVYSNGIRHMSEEYNQGGS